MEKKIKESQGLKRTLVNESLTKKERDIINSVKKMISEAPIDYEGPERMDPNIENTITKKETPFHGNPAVPKENRDFIEVVSSKRFKDSVEKVRQYLGDTTILQGRNPVNNLMQMAMGGLQKIMSIEFSHKEYLEKSKEILEIVETKIKEHVDISIQSFRIKLEVIRKIVNESINIVSQQLKIFAITKVITNTINIVSSIPKVLQDGLVRISKTIKIGKSDNDVKLHKTNNDTKLYKHDSNIKGEDR